MVARRTLKPRSSVYTYARLFAETRQSSFWNAGEWSVRDALGKRGVHAGGIWIFGGEERGEDTGSWKLDMLILKVGLETANVILVVWGGGNDDGCVLIGMG